MQRFSAALSFADCLMDDLRVVSLCLKTYVTHFHNVCFPLILQIRNIQNLLDINLNKS